MNVLVATAGDRPWHLQMRSEIEELARRDRIGEHTLVDDPDRADLILFVDLHQHPEDWRQRALRTHPYVRAFAEKSFVYDERDLPWDSLPGVYVSMPRSAFDVRRHRAFAYPRLLNDVRAVAGDDPDLLFSFQGRRVGPVRDRVLALSHPRAVVEDTSAYDFFEPSAPGLDEARLRYREVMSRSKFVLCPRGAGTSSVRIFEALACGRVPVVLSDDWVAPQGIDWESCSVRIPEADIRSAPARLEQLEPRWPETSTAARQVYVEWFADDVWFHRVVEHCRELREQGSPGLRSQWLQPAAWRAGARRWKHALR